MISQFKNFGKIEKKIDNPKAYRANLFRINPGNSITVSLHLPMF